MYFHYIILAILLIAGPILANRLFRGGKYEKWISPVVVAYILGIIIGNLSLLNIPFDHIEKVTQASVLIALPLLLFSTNFKVWLANARHIILAFLLSIGSACIITFVVTYFFMDSIQDAPLLSAMYLGGITGGTPNMQAIGIALEAPENTFILLNAADIVIGGIYLILLTSVWKSVLLLFLPKYNRSESIDNSSLIEQGHVSRFAYALIAGLTILIIGVSIGLSFMLYQGINSTFIILSITSFSVLASFNAYVRSCYFSFNWGEYLLLIFCISIGLLADFAELIHEGGMVILLVAILLISNVVLHLLFCKIFKIDADTAIIMNVAAVYGPVFVGQVASAIRNKDLIFPGIASSLVGLALGNYLGISFL